MRVIQNTNIYKKSFISIILIFAFVLLVLLTRSASRAPVFLDPRLNSIWLANKSVIVSAVDTETAVQAVTDSGGEINAELWLVNAVSASLTFPEFKYLLQQPGIISIVENKVLETAVSHHDGSDDDDDDHDGYPDRGFWHSNRRRLLHSYDLDGRAKVPPILLANNNIFIISEHGDGLILAKDGTVFIRFELDGGPFKTMPVAGPDGSVYVAGENKRVYAISETGTVRWQFKDTEKIKGGISLFTSADGAASTLYVVNESGTVTALNAADGALKWRYTYNNKSAGDAGSPPVIAENGTIYIVLENGHVLALNPEGTLDWVYVQEKGREFEYAPQIGPDGAVYVVNEKEDVIALYPDGQIKYQFETEKKITAVPVIADDGTLFVPVSEHLYALNSDGSVRFKFTAPQKGKFESQPTLAPDGSQLYIAMKEKWLFAVSTDTGELAWQYNSDSDLNTSPLVESNGDIHLVSRSGHYLILSSTGKILNSRVLSGDLETPPVFGYDEASVFLLTKANTVDEIALLPDSWDGGAFATPTDNPTIWNFTSVAGIDVGADELQDDTLQGGSPITGQGVTIAFVDSGIYIDDKAQGMNSKHLKDIFLGQADFVGSGACPYNGSAYGQNESFCWTTLESSYDDYGHGSHLAGIVWSNLVDQDTGATIGIAPNARILSIRVLDENGSGTYEDIVEGIQYAVAHKNEFNIRVLNLSISGEASVPYFVDPLNRAVEAAWANGIVVVAAAGNSGPTAQSITVPGNDPYVITVGAVHSNQTPGFWGDDLIPEWSAAGPTLDGFIKPDILAPGTDMVSFIFDDKDDARTPTLIEQYPEFTESDFLFRMHGTSTATAVTSGVVALILEAHPNLTPDEVKFRLMYTAKTAVSADAEPVYSVLKQGVGRLWAPDAVNGDLPAQAANTGLNIHEDLSHVWREGDSPDPAVNADLSYHYQGPVQIMESDDGRAFMFYINENVSNSPVILGVANKEELAWIAPEALANEGATFENGRNWNSYIWSGGTYAWSGGTYAWSGGTYAWSGGTYAWSGGTYAWSGGTYAWSGNAASDETQVSGLTSSAQTWVEDK